MTAGEWSSFEEMIGWYNRTLTVRDIMVRDVITAGEDTPVKEICRIMKNRKINHVIITSDSQITGIITARDIIGLVAEEGRWV
jgi:CBS domain-containing protein